MMSPKGKENCSLMESWIFLAGGQWYWRGKLKKLNISLFQINQYYWFIIDQHSIQAFRNLMSSTKLYLKWPMILLDGAELIRHWELANTFQSCIYFIYLGLAYTLPPNCFCTCPACFVVSGLLFSCGTWPGNFLSGLTTFRTCHPWCLMIFWGNFQHWYIYMIVT